ncbi:locomotion-related protein Hikaru genki-like [Argiope bruennichi]|uniref:Locomotion-related protein Hikaru genki like protein n=1 Tax=Argiope bruennichi TaxID=94029 RepID=A0A8T0FQR2_ARGBR|nr:locomotion-related protein Hikaru genki-like [Argiope bruennichi]KAF8792518.1 Locomotion-related protein Hikaru genki like protein [Argiope bruennichi]
MKTSLLLLLFVFLAVDGQRVAIRRRPPKKRPTTRPKSVTSPSEDIHGNLPPGSPEQTVSREGCSAPEVIVNGSLIPDGTTDFSTVQEIHFVGLIGRRGQKRECKIQCLNGVWVGPMCTEGGNPIKRIMRRCTLRLTDAELIGVTDENRLIPPDVEVSLPHDTEVRFRCVEPGLYKFVGNDTLLCDDGSWTSDLPYCVATTMHRNFSLQAPPTILYHVVSGDAGLAENGSVVVFPGTIINIDCLFQRQYGNPQWIWTSTQRQYPSAWAIPAEEKNWKFRLSIYYAKDSDSGTYTCVTPHDISNEVNIVVKDVHCPAIKSVDHNRVMAVEGNKMHSKARFACMEGFELVGPEEITCQASGQWSDEAPKCEVLKCPPLVSESKHLIVSTRNRTYGTRVVFSCPTGFKLSGAPFLNCLKTANWSEATPTCNPISCRPPVAPVNGRVLDTGRFLAGDFVQYTCNAGHVIVGESVAICTDHGVWSQSPPKCKAACEFPGEPSNGQVIPTKFHYDIGEVVMVGCHPGYRILGFQRLQCTSSSHWSSPLPHCRPYLIQS